MSGPVSPGRDLTSPPVTEREAWSASGVRVLVTGIVVALVGAAVLIVDLPRTSGATRTILTWIAVLLLMAAGLAFSGLTSVVAGEARVVQLFGRYRGTIRSPGLHWVNPIAPAAGIDPDPQPRDIDRQGQRRGRQPDRDRRGGRLAGPGHGAGDLLR